MKRLLPLFLTIVILFRSVVPTHDGLYSVVALCDEYDNSINLLSISDDYYSDAQLSLYSDNEIDVDAPEGWELYNFLDTKKKPIIVAVIDTGVDYLHEDLKNAMWVNPGEIPDNGIDDDNNGFIDDVYGWNFCDNSPNVCSYSYDEETDSPKANPADNDNHGTHIAGIIAAEADNGVGIAGLASYANVKIMSLKIHGGSDNSGNISRAVNAIRYAEMMGAKVCNISWGTYTNSNSLYKAIANSSMFFCAAAGNDGTNNDENPIYPASYDLPNVISVTVTGPSGNLTSKANYGKNSVDVAVPASEIYSTIIGGYAYMGGTSMAAPHVSAMAAMLFSLKQNYTPGNIKQLITMGVKPVKNLDDKLKHPGIPSLFNTLLYSLSPLPDVIAPTFTLNKEYTPDGVRITVNASDEGGSGVASIRYFIGERTADSFRNGTGGLLLDENNSVLLQKSGKYTFYVVDGDGNEAIKTYLITTDTLAPTVTNLNYSVSVDYNEITVTGNIYDNQSGVKNVRFLKGIHSISDFSELPAKKVTVDDNTLSFTVNEEGIYTILARDNDGNKALYTIRCYIRRTQSIDITRRYKEINVGESFTLKPTAFPSFTTDTFTFRSNDKSICKVSKDGVVTGTGAGNARITVRTSSGCSDTIEILVKEPETSENKSGKPKQDR